MVIQKFSLGSTQNKGCILLSGVKEAASAAGERSHEFSDIRRTYFDI